ncbi:MAG: hypothetical protein V4813_04620 [Gemmatimonadota bacterium]
MSAPIATTALPPETSRRRIIRLAPYLLLCLSLWLTFFGGRVPAFLSPTVERTLYFKLPIAGTEFHWTFLDRRAFLAGELTLRIVNPARHRDQTLVIFRNGVITKGWEMIGDARPDSSFYFGFATGQRFATTVGDSIILTLTMTEDLRGRGPFTTGTLPRGTYVATGSYKLVTGGTLNLLKVMARFGDPPAAYLGCWDTTWALRDERAEGWMGKKPADEDDVSFIERLLPDRGVDGRLCQSLTN